MSDTTGHAPHADDHGHGMGHAVPWPILVGVWLALMVLTGVTVAVTYVDLGALNIVIAMAVATMKASLVVAFFMHLFWDRPLNSITFLLSVAFVAVFLAFTIIDTKQYQSAIAAKNLEDEKSKIPAGGGGSGGAGDTWTPPTLDDEQKALFDKIKAISEGGSGDAAAGKAIFTQRCAICHKLGGEGNTVGPDLTDFDRQNKDRLVVSVAVPSVEIRKGYDNFMFRTKTDGVKMGVKKSETPTEYVISDNTGKEIKILKADMRDPEPRPAKGSLMPDGLFDNLSEDEVRNMLEYIKSVPGPTK